jgi:hypothetical protein
VATLAKYQIVSLLDMLDFDLQRFAITLRRLVEAECRCHEARESATRQGRVVQLDAAGCVPLQQMLKEIEKHAVALDLGNAVIDAVRDFIRRLDKRQVNRLGFPDCEEVENRLGELRRSIERQLQGKLFMSVPSDKATYWKASNPFGKAVTDRFPKATEDVAEAGNCLAAGRSTATVFHLMRVLEIGVQRLAARLAVTVNLNQTWGQVLTPIDAAIKALPGGTGATAPQNRRKEAFSEAAAYLRHVKDAWRNTTMHPKQTYTEQEAEDIYRNVRSFMQSLVRLRQPVGIGGRAPV